VEKGKIYFSVIADPDESASFWEAESGFASFWEAESGSASECKAGSESTSTEKQDPIPHPDKANGRRFPITLMRIRINIKVVSRILVRNKMKSQIRMRTT
jgi:hypothetical protein